MENNGKAKLFNLKFLPMDIGRIVSAVTLLLFPTKKIYISGKKKTLSGGALVAANHTSFKDPFIIGGAFWYRRVFFLAAEAVMKNRFLAFLLRGMGCIKINRNICDLAAIKKVVELLKSNQVVSVFPQGGIQHDEMSALKSGIVLMALKSKKPIIPAYISSCGIFRRRYVIIGEPIYFDTYSALPSMAEINAASDKLLNAMKECQNFFENYKGSK